MANLTETQLTAADWLHTNWSTAICGGPLTRQLRVMYGLNFVQAVAVIAEVRRRLAP